MHGNPSDQQALEKLEEKSFKIESTLSRTKRWRDGNINASSFVSDDAAIDSLSEVLVQIDHIIAYMKQNPLWSLCLKYHDKSKEELEELQFRIITKKSTIQAILLLLDSIQDDKGTCEYLVSYRSYKNVMRRLKNDQKKLAEEIFAKEKELDAEKKKLEKELKKYYRQNTINKIYQKLDPHDVMKNMSYRIEFNDNVPQLFIKMEAENGESNEGYQPEIYFSTAQLNTVAFSSFFGRAIDESELPIRTIFIDDPIDNFDDMNMLGFADLIRCIIESTDCQIVMTTHDPKVFGVMERKLDKEYHSSCFITI